MNDYRVQLDVYNGPMDLLLYLIRKEEVDIYDIPIARITEQYMEYQEVLRALDVDGAGEFLVLAATLMEIKSRMLLPHPPPLVEGEEGDPRAELVRELLEYQKYRDASEELRERAEAQGQKYPRLGQPELSQDTGPPSALREVELWDIFAAFRRLMKETMGRVPQTIVYDDIPVSEFMNRLVDRLRVLPRLRFWELFPERRDRIYIVGTFLALLELIRRRVVWAVQEEVFGDILLQLRPGGVPEKLEEEEGGPGGPQGEQPSEASPRSHRPTDGVQPSASPAAGSASPGSGEAGAADSQSSPPADPHASPQP